MGILEGKTAIIVGAGFGIGYGCALRYLEEGANVVACDISQEGLSNLEKEVGVNYQNQLVTLTCDVDKEEDLDQVVAKTVERFGRIDILACIAQGGLENPTNLLNATPDLALKSYRTGPLYTMLLIQKCFPYMKEQGYGRIITTASGSAVSGTVGFASYAMAKGAVMSLTRFAAKELGRHGITVNCFLPVIQGRNFTSSPQGQAAMEQLKQMVPVGYVGKPYEDASPILAFMASDGAHYMNGQMIGICGGMQILA